MTSFQQRAKDGDIAARTSPIVMTTSAMQNRASDTSAFGTMSFTGRRGDFLALLAKGSLLQIPTFGFYRFWLITKMRRHLWANTRIAGETFEYTGTAKELLLGFLIAMAVLVPVYILYSVLTIMLGVESPFATIPLVLCLYAFGRFASFRARAYRASRTTFRGLRFWMKGSGWAYAIRSILWDLLVILTLGLALPWAAASLERYRMRRTYFGTIQGNFLSTGWTLFKRGWWFWILAILVAPGCIVLVASLFSGPGDDPDLLLSLLPLGLVLVPVLLSPIFMAIYTRWQIDGMRMGGVALSSNLRKRDFIGVFLKMIFSAFGLLAVFSAAAVIYVMAYGDILKSSGTNIAQPTFITAFAIGALGYLFLLLGMGIRQRYFLVRGLWATTVGSITVSNLDFLDSVRSAGDISSSAGEGLANALDFGSSF